MGITHYDKNGKEIGHSSDDGDNHIFYLIGTVIFVTVIYTTFTWAIEKVTNWQALAMPYNYIAAFYNYIIGGPIKIGIDFKSWLNLQEFTQYPNLNIIITIIGLISYLSCIILIIHYCIKTLNFFGHEAIALLFLFISPALLGLAWFILLALFNWITATA